MRYDNSMFLNRLLFGGLLFVSSFFIAFPQNGDLKFMNLTREQGLSNSTVEAICQDSKGFMWFGTDDGLCRYDGYNITIYKNNQSDSNSISGNFIGSLFEDGKQRLWIGVNEGLNCFEKTTNTFIRYKNIPGHPFVISSNDVNCIYGDRSGNLWVGTAGGLDLFIYDSVYFKHFRPAINGIPSDNINCVFEDRKGNLWIGSNEGLALFDRKRREFISFKDKSSVISGLNSLSITGLQEDFDGNLWIGTMEDGLFMLDVLEKTLISFRHHKDQPSSISSDVIKSMLVDRKGNLWIGTENGGLSLWEPDKRSFLHFKNDPDKPFSLSQKTASAIFEDRQGNLWIGTHRGGINLYSPNAYKFNMYTQGPTQHNISFKDVKTFFEDDQGNIWIGTDGGGLNIWNRKKDTFTNYRYDPKNPNSIGSDAILHIMKDRRGNIWIGTWGGGLNLYNPSTGTFSRYLNSPNDASSISSNNIWRIYEDRRDNIWVATFYGGLNILDPKTRKFERIIYNPSDRKSFWGNNVVSINEDKSGNIWLGTEDGGLNCYDPSNKHFSHYFYKSQNGIIQVEGNLRVIFPDSKGRLWIGQKGLYFFNPETDTFDLFKSGSGLENEIIQGILEDNNGSLWISTNNGLVKLNPEIGSFKRFTDADGLQGLEFGPNACLKTTTGEMLFGGFKGFNIFNPNNIRSNTDPPPVYITDFQIFNKSVIPGKKGSPLRQNINETKEIHLSYSQRSFSFEFAALNYISSGKNQYAYYLDRFDKTWNYVGGQRRAIYTNLDPGDYAFHVKASNNDGIWNELGASIRVIITPPFWMTWWFRVLVVVLLLTVIYLVFYYRKKIELRKFEETKREEMHQIQLQFFTNISHEFRTPLSLILGPLEKIGKEDQHPTFKHYYKIMYRNANRLMGLISELMDFRKVESGALKLRVRQGDLNVFLNQIAEEFTVFSQHKQINFTIRQTVNPFQVWFDHQILEKIILNLLANSFKYTENGGSITMEILTSLTDFKSDFTNELIVKSGFKASSVAYLRIADSGIGISKESIKHLFERYFRIEESHLGSGIGLALVKSLTFIHKGDIYVYSEYGKGTEIIIGIPVGKEDYNYDELWNESSSSGGVQIESINYKYDSHLPTEVESKFPRLNSDTLPERSTHILLIDDNAELRNFLRESLEDFYFISEADNGNSGLMEIKEVSPDLIICDIMMPEMDGLELCRIVKDDIEISHIPFMLLTAKSTLEAKLEGAGSGADFYFEKPVNINLLLLTIKNIFDQKEKLKEKYLKDYQVGVRELVHSDKEKEFMDRLIKILQAGLENPDLNVEYLCLQIGMSKTSLYKKIKKITGQSINEFIRTTRLKKAVDIMVHEEILITEVMYRVGILSQSYFTTAFKREFGKTPSQFQQELDRKVLK